MSLHSDSGIHWILLALSLLLVAGYEVYVRRVRARTPSAMARTVHARFRAEWARAVLQRPGNEVLAIQTLRNGLMSSTVIASTAVLGLVGALSLAQPALVRAPATAMVPITSPGTALVIALIVNLFAVLVFSLMAMRFYNHAGYLLGRPTSEGATSEEIELAVAYVVRAGNQYSRGLRSFLWLLPIIAGLVRPLLLLPACVGLVLVLAWFDRSPEGSGAEV